MHGGSGTSVWLSSCGVTRLAADRFHPWSSMTLDWFLLCHFHLFLILGPYLEILRGDFWLGTQELLAVLGVLGIEPGSAVYKASTVPAILSLWPLVTVIFCFRTTYSDYIQGYSCCSAKRLNLTPAL